MWAFWLHRLTGLAIIFYLLMHILVIGSVVGGKENFDAAMKFLKAPIFILLEMGLLATIIIHGLNGIRIVLFDVGIGVKHQKEIFLAMMALGILPFLVGFAIAWPHIFP
jgi:succinate dehydrogenase / fumarate reductase cytochrome b subunit